MNQSQLQELYSKQAGRAYVKSDKERWNFNLWCHLAMYGKDGQKKYERGATLAIADANGISEDACEDGGNAYTMFRQMCELDGGRFRDYVFAARGLKYIYTAHFRALWEAKNDYNLSVADCLSMLVDVVQAEGGISSRKITKQVQDRFGDTRTWEYYAQRVQKEVSKTLSQPDLPKDVREVLTETFNILGDKA